MTWRPLLDGDDAARARALVAAIADELAVPPGDDPSLASGSAGIALLHGYRALDGDEPSAERAFDALAHALEHVMQQPVPGLYVGYGGIAFVAQHLQPVIGEVEALDDLDRLLRAALDDDKWTVEFELRVGLIGFGVHALERPALGAPVVERVVRALAARAEPAAPGWRWRTPPPDDGYNLGIAHGAAGVVAFLAEAYPCAPAESLLRGAAEWLAAQVRDDLVPSVPMTLERTEVREVVHDGWCYGEPATAAAFVRAGQVLGDARWLAAGHRLAQRAARRSGSDLAAVTIDTSLCHGTVSRAHLLNRLGQALGDDELLEAARGWYRATLARGLPFELEPGFQVGLAGSALGLLAACSPVEPAWDRALLTALPTAPPRGG